jgi:REP element-mobilizing transposase RayT
MPVAKRDYVGFQDRTQPLAYLITFRCYGTWLHGEERGSVDRRHYNRFGTPDMPANKKVLEDERDNLRAPAFILNREQRPVVASAIREVCNHRGYTLHAVNARTNHVHSIVSAGAKPEHIMNSLKSYATRKLREAKLLSDDVRPWARHGSTPYLWTEEELERAIDYVLNGKEMNRFVS